MFYYIDWLKGPALPVENKRQKNLNNKFQPIRFSRLAGYRTLFVFKGPVNVFSSDPHFIQLQHKLESVKLSLYQISFLSFCINPQLSLFTDYRNLKLSIFKWKNKEINHLWPDKLQKFKRYHCESDMQLFRHRLQKLQFFLKERKILEKF